MKELLAYTSTSPTAMTAETEITVLGAGVTILSLAVICLCVVVVRVSREQLRVTREVIALRIDHEKRWAVVEGEDELDALRQTLARSTRKVYPPAFGPGSEGWQGGDVLPSPRAPGRFHS